jgi:SNF2 family DNA or RNA helicase
LERDLAEYKPLKISGKIVEEYRDVVKKFNEADEHKILIMTSAGQFGLNIQRASVIFHYDQEWSLAKMEQRTGRAYRYGQKEKVLEYNLLAKGTIDFYIKKILHGKRNLSDGVLGDTPLTMNNIKDILNYE